MFQANYLENLLISLSWWLPAQVSALSNVDGGYAGWNVWSEGNSYHQAIHDQRPPRAAMKTGFQDKSSSIDCM